MDRKYSISEEICDGYMIYGLIITCPDETEYTYKYISYSKSETEALIKQMSCGEPVSQAHFDDIVRDFLLKSAYDKIAANGI